MLEVTLPTLGVITAVPPEKFGVKAINEPIVNDVPLLVNAAVGTGYTATLLFVVAVALLELVTVNVYSVLVVGVTV